MRIGVPRETAAGERRVALVPEGVARLLKAGHEVLIQRGAGADAYFADADYETAGATIVDGGRAVLAEAELVLKVQKPSLDEADLLRSGSTLVSHLAPAGNAALLDRLAERHVTALSMELVPRITRAQSMDALSSQATVAGYKAVLLGAGHLGKLLPMLTTAAGTLAPARVFILGAGVAGLQAIATARRLGAVVSAFDIRPVVREQVQSLGASFVEAEAVSSQAEGAGGYARELAEEQQQKVLQAVGRHIVGQDLVISTAQIPGKPAPLLITEEMVHSMRPGSVIVDLAAETGGNCGLTRADEAVWAGGVLIVGPTNLAATVPLHASQMYSKNLATLVGHLLDGGSLRIDLDDPIIGPMCVTHGGTVRTGR